MVYDDTCHTQKIPNMTSIDIIIVLPGFKVCMTFTAAHHRSREVLNTV